MRNCFPAPGATALSGGGEDAANRLAPPCATISIGLFISAFIPVLSEEPDLPEMSRRYRFNSGFRAVGRTGSTNTAIQPVKSHGVAERCANSGRMSGCEGVESADPRASREARLWRDKPWL